jgi:hypothetical protein
MLALIKPLTTAINDGLTSMITELQGQNDELAVSVFQPQIGFIADIMYLQRNVLTGNFVDIPYVKSMLEAHVKTLTRNLVPVVHQAYLTPDTHHISLLTPGQRRVRHGRRNHP